MNAKDDTSSAIAKRAVKISIACIFITLLLSMVNIYILINQIIATASMSKEIATLQEKLGIEREKPAP